MERAVKHSISIIMPAYNEGGCIFDNIRMTRDIMIEAGIDVEIVAVDDGSSDTTLEEIRRAAKVFGNVVVAGNPYNMGKGRALRSGFEYSSGEIVVFLDADLDLHPSQIKKLIDVIEETPCDVVVTSKHHPESRLDYPFSRKIASLVYYIVIRSMFNLPVRDTQTGLKVFRRKVLDDVLYRLLVKKFAYDVELLATAVRFGYKVHEVPVVLEFKRDLKWGRISIEDMFNLFIDTLAVFYRLKIMKYYDSDRPPVFAAGKQVLIVVQGCPPPDDVIRSLTYDTGARIVCVYCDSNADDTASGIDFLREDSDLEPWLDVNAGLYEIVGFLGKGCLPVGPWVKNAVRNFENPEVSAVCGPVIPGSFDSPFERASGLVYSSVLARGSDAYLYSYRPVKDVCKGLTDTYFLRSALLNKGKLKQKSFSKSGRHISINGKSSGSLKYDPDVAVLKKVPSLFMPYLRFAAKEAFSDGYNAIGRKCAAGTVWPLVMLAVLVVLSTGWLFVPGKAYMILCLVYAIAVLLTALSCFDPVSAPLFALGIVCDHIVRAVAFPVGLITRLVKGKIY